MRLSPCTHGIRPPEFPELPWFNVDAPLRLEDLLGQVVMLGFWSSSCIRCQEGIPAMRRALERFEERALQIIAVHSPRFAGEHDLDYVRSAVGRVGVPFAVAVDNDHRLARTFSVRELPTVALIDPRGYVCRVLRGVPEPLQLIDALEGLLGLTDAPRAPRSRPHWPADVQSALRYPAGISLLDDRVAIADTGHHRIVIAARTGEVLGCVGGFEPGFEDGPAEQARFSQPRGLLYDGDRLLVADTGNHAIRTVELHSGLTETLAILPPGEEGRLHAPWALARQGSWIFVACAGTHTLLRMDLHGTQIERFAGTGHEDRVDGHRSTAALAQPTDLALSDDRLFIIDSTSSALRCLNVRSNRVQTLLGKSLFEHGLVDGPARRALMQHPRGVALHQGCVYIADSLNALLRRFDPESDELITLHTPEFDFPTALASDNDVLLVCDTHAHTIWEYHPAADAWERLTLTWPDDDATAPYPISPPP